MFLPHRSILLLSLLAFATCAGGESGDLISLELEVPPERAQTGPAAEAPAAVLLLEGVEIRPGERLRIVALGPPAEGSDERPVLGSAALVGSGDADAGSEMQKTTLVIPFDQAGSELLVGRERIELALRVEAEGDRPPLRFESARVEVH